MKTEQNEHRTSKGTRSLTVAALLIMALLAQGKVIEADDSPGLCDQQFRRVDTRTPAHLLPPGVAADALNTRFEDGRAWPRYECDQQAWGQTGISAIPAGARWLRSPTGFYYKVIVEAGATYYYLPGQTELSYDAAGTQLFSVGIFLGPANGAVYLQAIQFPGFTADLVAQNGPLILRTGNICGYSRFQDPTSGLDTQVLLTDDWRDQAGEDGGRGRPWRILPNNPPQQIPMNGHDIYGTARLIPCQNGLVMFRQDEERHYFSAASITGADAITLNCQPTWNTGDQVYFAADGTVGSALTGGNGPAGGSYCYVKNVSLAAHTIKLYADAAMTQAYTFTGGIGRFYLERAAAQPGFGGNGAPPLLAQPDAAGDTLFDVGFGLFPANVGVTGQSNSGGGAVANLVSAANHRLIPGDSVNYVGGSTVAGYASPVNDNQFYVYTTVAGALANAGAYANLPAFNAADYVVKTTASAQPMPPCREGFYTQQGCLVGVNGASNLFISLPNDPLHTIPLVDQVTANLGEADDIVAICEVPNQDALIIFKQLSVLALYNFAEGLANNGQSWVLDPVTREYGCIAPLSVKLVGSNVFFVSARGVDRVEVNAFGTVLPVLLPVSDSQQAYISQAALEYPSTACAEIWNKRYVIALPALGQPLGAAGPLTNAIVGGPQNNLVLSCFQRNSDPAREEWGWEGLWTLPANPYGFARLSITGVGERLCFCDVNGNVNWFSDGWQDFGLLPINTSLTTRLYTGGTMGRKIFKSALVIWATYDSELSVSVIAPGVNRSYPCPLAPYNAEAYLQGPNVEGGYNPATQVPPFNTPFRQDYTPQQLSELIGNVLEQLQDITQPLGLRVDARGVQLQIKNARGLLKITSVSVGGMIGPSSNRLHA